MKQRRRQAILEHFDADGDGQLSNEERQAVRAAMKERHDKRDTKSARKGPPPSGE